MNPVQYSATNQAIVDQFEGKPADQQAGAYWSDDEVHPVRKQIKTHYIGEQARRCCYCNVEIPMDHHAVWDAEHIISRDGAARFMFVPRNLAIACKPCNGFKSEQEVRKNPTRVSFPDKSEHYLIVHPHFDEYSEHIVWVDKLVWPQTEKGIATVAMCRLHRFGLKQAGAAKVERHPATFGHIGKLLDPQADSTELSMALAAIADFLKTIPQD